MVEYKKFVGDMLLNKDVHVTCDCILSFNLVGKVITYNIEGTEIIYSILTNGKIVKVGENTPGLKIEFL
jgi:hypothetical protein